MAETQKKYVDLNGLGYAIRKINTTKADIESPVFTGTPKIGKNNIATTEFVNTALADYVEKKNYVTDPEIQDMIDEILDGEGEVVDKVSYAQLVARVEALEALVVELLKVNVNDGTLVFTME